MPRILSSGGRRRRAGFRRPLVIASVALDHRLNSRIVAMNPIFRFVYWNMNHHVEHHMFPMVPYRALPRLHEVVKQDCPRAYPSISHSG